MQDISREVKHITLLNNMDNEFFPHIKNLAPALNRR